MVCAPGIYKHVTPIRGEIRYLEKKGAVQVRKKEEKGYQV
jgi:hypothetical protein